MIKKVKLKKQESSKKNIPQHKLKSGINTKVYDPLKKLTNKELVGKALWDCILDNDIPSFKEILAGHLDAMNIKKNKIASNSKLSKRTIHRILSPNGNPTLKNICNLLHTLHNS